jgi:hypothetical protein
MCPKTHDLPDTEIPSAARQKLVAQLLLEFIFHSPALFACTHFREDAKSGFLLRAHRVLPNILENFDPSKGCFFSYFVSNIRMLVKGYMRELAKRKAGEDSVVFCYAAHHEGVYEMSEGEPEYHGAAPGAERPAVTRKTEKTLLVLALKNAYAITGDQIKHIAHIAGFENEKLALLVERAKTSLLPKEAARQRMIESRNKAYYLKTRYSIELGRLPPQSPQYYFVEKQYAAQARLMDRKNELLKNRLRLVPSNTYVGALLDMPPRNVARLITEAADTFNRWRWTTPAKME